MMMNDKCQFVLRPHLAATPYLSSAVTVLSLKRKQIDISLRISAAVQSAFCWILSKSDNLQNISDFFCSSIFVLVYFSLIRRQLCWKKIVFHLSVCLCVCLSLCLSAQKLKKNLIDLRVLCYGDLGNSTRDYILVTFELDLWPWKLTYVYVFYLC